MDSHLPLSESMRIGVLALQGDFARHLRCIELAGYQGCEVRTADDFAKINALILPGGESTTMTKLLMSFGMWEHLRSFIKSKPVWGTCAGMVLLASEVTDGSVPTLSALDISVVRNAYGRQVHSFEEKVNFSDGGEQLAVEAAFIRAPKIRRVGAGVAVLAVHNGEAVAVRSGHIMATSFHSELQDDPRLTTYFIERIALSGRVSAGSSGVVREVSGRPTRKSYIENS